MSSIDGDGSSGPRIYRASSIGYSLEALVAPHLGFSPIPPPAWLQAKFDEGSTLEPLIIDFLKRDGWAIQTTQSMLNSVGDYQIEVHLNVIPGVAKIVGHVDGFHYADAGNQVPGCAGSRVLEVKTMAKASWEKFRDKGWDAGGVIEKYKWQISAYMLATGMPATVVAWNKDKDISKTFTGDSDCIIVVSVQEPFYLISDFAARLAEVESCIADGEIPEGCTDYPCAYFYLHAGTKEIEPANPELDWLLSQWLEADKKEKEYKKEKDLIREEILAQAEEKGSKVKGSQGVTVSTAWQREGTVSYVKKAQWVTEIRGPRTKGEKAKDGE